MARVAIDGTMTLELPEGFFVMDKGEVQKAFALDYDCLWGARDEDRHMMLACIWKDAPALLGKMTSTKALVERAEKALRKTYAKAGYHHDGSLRTQIAGLEAEGFSYGFSVGDVAQQAETLIVRHGKRTYTLYYYTRPECAGENRAAHDALLASAELAEA